VSEFSVVMTTATHERLCDHLVRADGQEDLAFVIWSPSNGSRRQTAVISEVVLPTVNERFVHGNVSFASAYFLRACARAAEVGGGVGLIHSHPGGRRWQGLSADDFAAESGHAGQALTLTGLPIIGLTMAGRDRSYSARTWRRIAPRDWRPDWAKNVRVVGDRMLVSLPTADGRVSRRYQRRTIDAWGPEVQHVLGSLRIGVAGAGSVGSQVVEALTRTGFGEILVLDFDAVEDHNLDRIINASPADARSGRLKAELAATAARTHATAPGFVAEWSDHSAVEAAGIAQLKDCDVIFSCVDRPAGRASLNALAYAHLIPVVDGGVIVDPGRGRMRGAEWRAHVAAPGRRCLECLGQYDPGLVQADRDGLLDDPSYLIHLPADHPLHHGENVFAFSTAAAANQVLAALRMLVAPAGIADVGAQLFHFSSGTTDIDERGCEPDCPYDAMTGTADASGYPAAARHVTAEIARGEQARRTFVDRAGRRLGAALASLADRINARHGR
jgi:hypothetical protein